MRTIKSIIVIATLFLTVNSYGQNVLSPVEAHFNVETVNNGNQPLSPENMDPLNMSMGDTVKLSIAMQLADTNNVSKIHIKVGTVDGGSDLILKTYLYDIDSNLGVNNTYTRIREYITLGFGKIYNSGSFFGEIEIEDNSGNKSIAKKILVNISQ